VLCSAVCEWVCRRDLALGECVGGGFLGTGIPMEVLR